MLVTTRHINCNFCGEWAHVDDTETAREARKRLGRRGWRVLPNADQSGRLMDACPKHPVPAAPPSGVVGGPVGAGEGAVAGSGGPDGGERDRG